MKATFIGCVAFLFFGYWSLASADLTPSRFSRYLASLAFSAFVWRIGLCGSVFCHERIPFYCGRGDSRFGYSNYSAISGWRVYLGSYADFHGGSGGSYRNLTVFAGDFWINGYDDFCRRDATDLRWGVLVGSQTEQETV